ncbi:MAG: tautomerase PptA [Kiritimatiellae bacterium]|nr:tautomerase PptA [Kiritimatiellia bacterium]MBQ3344825.1 tautomerase PptA [Kiritimatiellia bacterium]
MPHISVKCYPKHLTKAQLDAYVGDIARVTREHLKATDDVISVSYAEVPAEDWKSKVYDKEIKPNLATLAKKPGYEM